MSVGPIAVELFAVFCLAFYLLHHYGNIRKHHPVVTMSTLLAWYFSLIIVFILPLDVSSTLYRKCHEKSEVGGGGNDYGLNTSGNLLVLNNATTTSLCEKPLTYVPQIMLAVMWRIVYWSSQSLTWVILPFLQSYTCSGHFSTIGKLKHAFVRNAVYYGTYVFIFFLLVIYVAASPNITLDFSQLQVIGITASNTWGLFLLVLLLGYGLVEVPRSVWRFSNTSGYIAFIYFKLAKLSTNRQDERETMNDLLTEVERISLSLRYNHPLRKNVDTIVQKCPKEFQEKIDQGMDDFIEYDDSQKYLSEKSLIRLHTRLIQSVQRQKRNATQWNILLKKAIYLDSVSKNAIQARKLWTEQPYKKKQPILCASFKWYWECKIRPILLRIVAIFLMSLSIIVIWSECTFFNRKPVLSLFAIYVNSARESHSYFYIELTSCLIIAYLCICAYYTIFRIKFFNIYYIAGHHQTDESSLMFIGMMLCRLTPPMCLNFLGLIQLDTHVAGDADIETSYTGIMGHLDVIPIISKGFNIYFPMLVVVLCLATYVSLGRRCMSCLGFQQFIDGQNDDEFTADLIEEGRQLVDREIRRLTREMSEVVDDLKVIQGIRSRKWRGRAMKEATYGNALSKTAGDKVELLENIEPIGYESTVEDSRSSDSLLDRIGHHSPNYSPVFPSDSAKRHIPIGIFDDV